MATANYTVTIGGVSYTPLAGSLRIGMAVGKKTQASLSVRTNTSTFFQQYQQVLIKDGGGTLVFSGYITSPKTVKPGFQPSLVWSLSCIGQEYLAKKRIVQATYTNKTCGFIAHDILNTVLASEGVTAGTIYDGPTCSDTLYCSNTLVCDGNALLPQVTFFTKVADALDSLVQSASAAGVSYYWAIDQNKVLTFAPYGSTSGPAIDDTKIDQVNNAPSITFANPNYRNSQYVTGGVAQTSSRTETITGDGNTRSFVLGFQLASAPTIVISGVTQTVGLKGSSGAQFYWAQGDNTIVQDNSQTVLAAAATGSVTYIGQYPNTALVSNAAQIAYQSSIDGSSGINEEIQSDQSLTTANNALTEASNLLTRYAAQGAQLQATTRAAGYAPGQLCSVNMPYFNLVNTSMLLESVSIADLDGLNIWYTFTGIVGPYDTTWVDFWSRILSPQPPANNNAQSTTSTSVLVDLTTTISPSDNLNISVYACPITGNATLCGNSTIVC